jgi:hypothetical protein
MKDFGHTARLGLAVLLISVAVSPALGASRPAAEQAKFQGVSATAVCAVSAGSRDRFSPQ